MFWKHLDPSTRLAGISPAHTFVMHVGISHKSKVSAYRVETFKSKLERICFNGQQVLLEHRRILGLGVL